VPLFIEELTKAVREAGDGDGRIAVVLAASAIPATLHASLIARLDRLGPVAKEVAQIGAVIGREFSYELIEAVAQQSDAELGLGLDRLAEAGLLFRRGVPPQASYLFKHALVQDTAYGTLLRAKRQQLHMRAAAVLERYFPDLVKHQPELLAHHLTAAGDTDRAVDQWLKAGQHAAERLAHLEAIRHFERGLALLPALPEGPARDGREVDLQLARGLSLITAEGFVSQAANQSYRRARELGEKLADPRQLVTAVYGLWQWVAGSGDLIEGRSLSTTLLELTAAQADDGLRLQAHHSAWPTCLHGGEPAAALEHSAAGRRLYDPERHRAHRLLFGGHDPGVCARMFYGLAHWVLGYPEQALAGAGEGVALAERLAHPLSLEDALLNLSLLHLGRGEPEIALQRLDAAQALATEQRLGFVREPLFLRGDVLIAQGAVEEGVRCLREGLGTLVGRGVWRTYALASLANGLMRLGKLDQALAAIGEGQQRMKTHGERLWGSELHRIKGLVLLRQNDVEASQTALEEALQIARMQQAKAYELRAATSLARLWGEQGRRAEARELLAPVYGWFTEGFDTEDLKEAKALSDELV
jgi:tetratricopeptide (TPR) repeat protein